MKKILFALTTCFAVLGIARSGKVANLEYVHNAIQSEWGFMLPFNELINSQTAAANMKYLLHAMDETNFTVNSEEISNYAEDKLATLRAADTVATDQAVVDLIDVRGLTFRTTTDTTYFEIKIAAKGTFTIKWGDGTNETFTQDTTDQKTYSHTYDRAEAHYIKLLGQATEYNSSGDNIAFQFSYGVVNPDIGEVSGAIPTIKIGTPEKLYKIYNSLGSVFPTLSNGSQPSFNTFCDGCTNLVGPIPANLLAGISGKSDKAYQFRRMFLNCYKLDGEIPAGMFANITGRPTTGMFMQTFYNCKSLKGSIPEDIFGGLNGDVTVGLFYETFNGARGLTGTLSDKLFANIGGVPQPLMFLGTFGCVNLPNGECWSKMQIKGAIPEKLFGKIEGAPAYKMFHSTFAYSGHTGKLPAGLFAGIKGPGASAMFEATFQQARGLGGPLPEDLFAGIKWSSGMERAFAVTFCQAGSLGWNIPEGLFTKYDENGNYVHGIEGAPVSELFASTFLDAAVNKLPPKLFAGIKGAPAMGVFASTFYYNTVGDIPEGFFDGIEGEPAESMFSGTFSSTWGITKIPKGLFAGISGEPAKNMFNSTFDGSTALVNIGYDAATGTSGHPIFGNITGEWVSGMFSNTFANDTKLASESAKMTVVTENDDGTFTTADKFLYEVWPTPPGDANTYSGATGLTDYANIPELWK